MYFNVKREEEKHIHRSAAAGEREKEKEQRNDQHSHTPYMRRQEEREITHKNGLASKSRVERRRAKKVNIQPKEKGSKRVKKDTEKELLDFLRVGCISDRKHGLS